MVTAACKRLAIDRADYRFSRRDIREHTGWGHTQLKVHLKRLEELEYLLIHRGGRGQSFVYELLYDAPPDAAEQIPGPADRRGAVAQEYDATGRGWKAEKSGNGRPQVGVKSGRSRPSEIGASADGASSIAARDPKVDQNANLDREEVLTS